MVLHVVRERLPNQVRQHLSGLVRKPFLWGELLDFKQLLSGIYRRSLIPKLEVIRRFPTAHPTGAMDFSFGESPRGTVCPCKDILFASDLAENLFFAMGRVFALLAIVTAVSVQLCSLLDSSGRLQESSRKCALLQAAYPARGESVKAHYLALSVLDIVPLVGRLSKSFLQGEQRRICVAISKEVCKDFLDKF